MGSGDGHDVEDALNHAILIDTGSFGFERQDDPVAQYIEQHCLNVFGADEVTSGQPGMCAGAAVQRNGTTRAGTVGGVRTDAALETPL